MATKFWGYLELLPVFVGAFDLQYTADGKTIVFLMERSVSVFSLMTGKK
jgi:hypothetical protein